MTCKPRVAWLGLTVMLLWIGLGLLAWPARAETPGGAGWPPDAAQLAPTRAYTPLAETGDYRSYLPVVIGGDLSPEEELLAAINAERSRYGLGPLVARPILMQVAEAHSQDMATRDYFDHTSPEGVNPCQRMTSAGYQWWACGENIGAGFPSAQLMLTAWLNSPGHRSNILSIDFTDIGVGYAPNGYYGHYWTTDFGAPR
jgi:uncharacterized protein YkwD